MTKQEALAAAMKFRMRDSSDGNRYMSAPTPDEALATLREYGYDVVAVGRLRLDETWAEQVIDRWAPDERSRAIEAEARRLAGANHVRGAIPARFWREAIAREYAKEVEK